MAAVVDSQEGILDPEKLYSFDAFERITGVARAGLRAMRSNGLRVRYTGRQGYILGKDAIEYIMSNGKDSR